MSNHLQFSNRCGLKQRRWGRGPWEVCRIHTTMVVIDLKGLFSFPGHWTWIYQKVTFSSSNIFWNALLCLLGVELSYRILGPFRFSWASEFRIQSLNFVSYRHENFTTHKKNWYNKYWKRYNSHEYMTYPMKDLDIQNYPRNLSFFVRELTFLTW